MNWESRSETLIYLTSTICTFGPWLWDYLINTRSTSKRSAASCAKESRLTLSSPNTNDWGICSNGAQISSLEGREAVDETGREAIDEAGEVDGARPIDVEL